MEKATMHPDGIRVRATEQNNRECDHARPDYYAGLHKYVLTNEADRKTWICVVCGRCWMKGMQPK